MVRDEAHRGRGGVAVWRECTVPKDESEAKAAAAASRSNQNSSRRRGKTAPSYDSGASTAPSTSAPSGNAAATSSSHKATSQPVSATANGWLEAPPTSTAPVASLAAATSTVPATASNIRPLSTALQPTNVVSASHVQPQQESAHSGEVFLMEMLAAMDQHMQQLRETQQGLVATVEMACRRALGRNFVKLVLVGSVALRVETPGSDVDVVCFTRRDGQEGQQADAHYDAVGLPVDVLRRVHWALEALVSQYADHGAAFSMELIDDARVPILRVLWGQSIAVDVSVDQSRPVDHVRWFQTVGAAPRPTAPPPAVAPLVTLTLRCVKWWLRQRQVPRTKEGGMATIAWLLMAVHVCSLPETHEQAIISGQRPMVALLASLAAFFHHYAQIDGLDGVLCFAADGSSSEFRRGSEKKPSPRASTTPWGGLSVLDPTREGNESLDLAPRLHPATHLLLSHELRRASEHLRNVPKGREASYGAGRAVLQQVFEPLREGVNALPSFVAAGVSMGALMLVPGEENDSTGLGTVELCVIDNISPRPGWQAPFLHRSDDRSELSCRVLDQGDKHFVPRKSCNPEVALCPCHFICQVTLEKDGQNFRLSADGQERMKAMKWCVAARSTHLQTQENLRMQEDLKEKENLKSLDNVNIPENSAVQETQKTPEASETIKAPGSPKPTMTSAYSQSLLKLPSPSRNHATP